MPLSLKDKADKVIDWAKKFPKFEGYLKLNAIVTVNGEASLVTNPVDVTDVKYIDGTADRRFLFDLRIILPWSDGFDGTNENSMAFATELYDWVVEQNELKSYPEWEGATITEAFPTQSFPTVNFVYEEDELAEYLVSVEIDYTE